MYIKLKLKWLDRWISWQSVRNSTRRSELSTLGDCGLWGWWRLWGRRRIRRVERKLHSWPSGRLRRLRLKLTCPSWSPHCICVTLSMTDESATGAAFFLTQLQHNIFKLFKITADLKSSWWSQCWRPSGGQEVVDWLRLPWEDALLWVQHVSLLCITFYNGFPRKTDLTEVREEQHSSPCEFKEYQQKADSHSKKTINYGKVNNIAGYGQDCTFT